MDLKTYTSQARGLAAALAAKLGISQSYLSQLSKGLCPISPERAVEIERATDGAVTRKDLFKDTWQNIWPELAEPRRRRKTDH